jgi:broad specificity phosphatase PhoE
MATLRYLTHPQVEIDLTIPVTAWRLSELGRARAARCLEQPWIVRVGRVISSPEAKALEFARMIGGRLRLEVELRADTGENDRASTGPLPPVEFARLADRFFAEPSESVAGWERAVDAQRRIAMALADLFAREDVPDVAIVGHGGVGTLWYCHLAGLPIDRRHDQPSQGHYFSVDVGTRRPLHGWRPIDGM